MGLGFAGFWRWVWAMCFMGMLADGWVLGALVMLGCLGLVGWCSFWGHGLGLVLGLVGFGAFVALGWGRDVLFWGDMMNLRV